MLLSKNKSDMKKINIILVFIAALGLTFNSCSEDYLETTPTDQLAEGAVFTTLENAWATLNGTYRAMYIQYSAQDQAGHASVMINSDMLGEDLVMTAAGNGWFNTVYKWDGHRNENNGTLYFIYRFYYKIIANANMIIANIDNIPGAAADKSSIKGQALALRAFCHYQLVQFFGDRYNAAATPNSQLGVSIMTFNTSVPQPRGTVEEVYTQVMTDINEAITLLGTAPARPHKSHINLAVAKGIKARVALTMQNYPLAAQMADEARTGLEMMTNTEYKAGFSTLTNREFMWGLEMISEHTVYFYSYYAYMSWNFNSTNIRQNPKAINANLYALIPATDVRKTLWEPAPTTTNFPLPATNYSRFAYMNRKFSANSSSNSWGDVPYMRVGEMFYIAAEAYARMGGAANELLAQQRLFTVNLNRDPSYVQSVNTGQALIDEIMIYRRVELWGEGHRYLDLKRTNSPLVRPTGGPNAGLHQTSLCTVFNIPAGDIRWTWLLPKAEIDASKGVIVQNPL
jgi:starch-binding outer membrane protein, SusD/RagB family